MSAALNPLAWRLMAADHLAGVIAAAPPAKSLARRMTGTAAAAAPSAVTVNPAPSATLAADHGGTDDVATRLEPDRRAGKEPAGRDHRHGGGAGGQAGVAVGRVVGEPEGLGGGTLDL